MVIRDIEKDDVPALFPLRAATRENRLSIEQLDGMGINEKSVAAMLETTHRGWLCEADGSIVGFSMGNRDNGEMWVIAMLPEYEGRGIGAELLSRVECWLWKEGWKEIWLTTNVDPSLRAYGFYIKQGWTDSVIKDNMRYMKKTHRS